MLLIAIITVWVVTRALSPDRRGILLGEWVGDSPSTPESKRSRGLRSADRGRGLTMSTKHRASGRAFFYLRRGARILDTTGEGRDIAHLLWESGD